jgi:hypothetical protein
MPRPPRSEGFGSKVFRTAACSQCSRPVGKLCVSKNGKEQTKPHQARVDEYHRIKDSGDAA